MNIEEESIQLISEEQNKFYLTPQAKKWLTSLDKPLSIITIAGAYRSGKSYLVNRLLKNRTSGFATGASIQPVTKGLNAWSRPIPARDQTGKQFLYLVLDSEGVGSCEQQTKYDSKLLALVCLISSTVIYNSQGAIDEGTLDQLRIVSKLKQCLKGAGNQDKGRLVWVLRDFALQLVGKNGTELSPDEYLQMCLQQTPSNNSEIRKKNDIRKGIKQTFDRRRCFTLVRPTINQQDLRNLDKCRPRPQFLEGIQTIRQAVFSGSKQDIKTINGSLINGRLLVSLLQQCLNQLNGSKMPEIKMIWELISECANEETYERICVQMKQEINRINLPIIKEDLRTRLNQIQNKAYNRLQKQLHSINDFNKYHKQLLHQIQKLNKDIKKTNAQILKEKTLKQLRIFTNSNIDIQSIEPTNLSVLKIIVQRMELKIRGEPQGYEYALSVLFDILQISEHKSQRMQREASQRLKALQSNSLQRRASDQTIASLRHDYHEALKTISNLKTSQQTCQKQAALLRQKLEMMQNHCKSVQQESQIKVQELIRQLEQNGNRARHRVEESVHQTKRLRDQNAQLERELEAVKQERLREGLNERKQIIFQEKMKETWDKFQQQRIFFRKQVQKLRKSSQANLKLYEQQRRAKEKQSQQFKRQKEILIARQKQYLQQLNQIKTMHAQTKKTYSATFDAFKDNDRIFKCIENVPPKTATSKKVTEQIQGIRKQYQSQLQRTRSDYEGQIKQLKIDLSKVNSSSHHQRLRLSDQQSRCHSLTMEKQRLQRQLQNANLRLTDTLSEIQAAKERQRSLYQQSIVRLLNNFQKRQYSSQSNFYKR